MNIKTHETFNLYCHNIWNEVVGFSTPKAFFRKNWIPIGLKTNLTLHFHKSI